MGFALRDQDILHIRNTPEFSAFRHDVLAYDYPFCSSCNVAPCDYVQAEEFEQDCHISKVPLWVMPVEYGGIPVSEVIAPTERLFSRHSYLFPHNGSSANYIQIRASGFCS